MERLWRRAAKARWDVTQNIDKPISNTHKAFSNSDEWFDWWMSNKSMHKEVCQMGLF
jgi:hypothetical protein